MKIDIRFPIGLLFGVLGLLLVVFGLTSDSALYQRSLGINVNLWWGIVLALGGAMMLLLSRKGVSKRQEPIQTPESETEDLSGRVRNRTEDTEIPGN